MTVRSAPRWFSISFRPPPPVRPRLDLAIVRARAESPVLDFTGGERGTRTLDLGIMSKSFQQLTAWRPLQLAPRSTTKHYWVPQNSHKKCSLSSHWPRARSVFTDRYPAGSSAARSKPAATAIGQYRTVAVTMSGSMRSLASSGAH